MAEPGKGRLGRSDWLEVGLGLLAEQGEQSLTIEQLCAAAGRTRGSFYHHFEDQEQFVESLLHYWKQSHADPIVASNTALNDPEAMRDGLARMATCLDNPIEAALRRWSASNANVRRMIEAVDAERIFLLADIMRGHSERDETETQELALVEYSAMIGFHQLFPDATAEMAEQIARRVRRLIPTDRESETMRAAG
ncbi:MAG: TetR/AcrR family transcriptional regulator [Pseudomonadota bacterium]